MNLSDAFQQAGQILNEERIHPTVSYETSTTASAAFGSMSSLAPLAHLLVQNERGKIHPRVVREKPELYQFKSVNFDLLCTILDQLREQDRTEMLAAQCSRLSYPVNYRNRATGLGAGSWEHCSSELPLVAEFMVRRGNKQTLIDALGKAILTPGLTLLLLQLEEMIAFNFTAFTDAEYMQIPRAIAKIENAIEVLKGAPKPVGTIASNTHF